MNKKFVKLSLSILFILLICLPSCKNNNPEQKPATATKADSIPPTKKPFIVVNGFTAALGFTSFGDAKDCMNKGICGTTLDKPQSGAFAPTILLYKQGVTPAQGTLMIMVNPNDITPPPPPGNFPPTVVGTDPTKPLIINKVVLGTTTDITIPSGTAISFSPANTPPDNLPVGVLTLNF